MEKEIKLIGENIIKEVQSIIKLNGTYKTGRLYNSFKIKTTETELGLEFSVYSTVNYGKYIDLGTYQWKNKEQQKEPVLRKYKAIDTGSKGYPFNKEGIEPIHFSNAIQNQLTKLVPILQELYTTKIASIILKDLNNI